MNKKDIEKAVTSALNKWILAVIAGVIFGTVVAHYAIKYLI